MFSQPEVESTSPTHKINEQALYTAGISVSYITLAIGYLLGILQANHLTLLNFLAFTLLQVSYCALLVWLIQFDPPRWQSTLCISALTFITIGSGMVSIIGIQFDWLIYLVTISIYFQSFSIRTSTILTILLYLAMGINLSFINNWQWYYVVSWSSPMLTLLPAFVFVAAFSLTVRVLGAQRDRAEQLLGQLVTSNTELEQAHKQLQEYANEVEELTITRERTRLAREIHDTLGHYLSILTIQLETISKLQERDPARTNLEIAEARRVAAQSMQEVRNAVAALRPTSIATLTLSEAIAQLGREFEHSTTETQLTLDLETQLPTLSPDLQLALYRAVQETLTNVRKHAHASKVLARLRYEDDALELVVLDNGQNTTTDSPTSGFGLIGLRERIELLGGHITYGPTESAGFRVTIHVPIPVPVSSQSITITNLHETVHIHEESSHEQRQTAHSHSDC
jgi:signal transduction histidine kinase